MVSFRGRQVFGQCQRSTALIRLATSPENPHFNNDLRYAANRPHVLDALATVAILTSSGLNRMNARLIWK